MRERSISRANASGELALILLAKRAETDLVCSAPRMAELVIHLQIDPETGKKNLLIEYESDSDMLPIEHEEEHRRLVDQIVEGGMVKAEDLGKVVIKRDGAVVVQVEAGEEASVDERESLEQGS